MKILILTQWFDPEPTIKGLMFARELASRGHSVRVITGFPNYPGGRVYPDYRIVPFRKEKLNGIEVWRVPLYPSHNQSGVARTLNYVSFGISASLASLLAPRPQVTYVYHPPATIGLAALTLRFLRGVPIVYDIQDLWPDTLRATGMIRSRTILRLVAKWMRLIYTSASHIVVLSPGFRDRLIRLGISAQKITVIPNWSHEDERMRPPHTETPPHTEFDGKRFNVLFAGTMGRAQDLDTVVNAADLLRQNTEVQFILVGSGIERSRLMQEAASRHLTNVTFLDRRPPSEMPGLFAAADCLLVHLRRDPLFSITIPSKTQSYMRAGRPILMGVEGDAARVISDSQSGLSFTPSDPQALAEAVTRMHLSATSELEDMGSRGAAYYSAHLSLHAGVSAFDKVFTSVAGQGQFILGLSACRGDDTPVGV